MAVRQFLAIDLGAESGRGVIGEYDGARVSLREIGRFPTGGGDADLCDDGVFRWDIDRIYAEIRGLLDKALQETGENLSGIAVDSWAVDFGLFDENDHLIAAPTCYRERSHPIARDEVQGRVSAEELWDASGVQGHPFNTLYQLAALQKRDPDSLSRARKLLMIPDLLHHWLTEGAYTGTERTNAGTTQMMTAGAADWNYPLLEQLNLPYHFLGPIVDAGTTAGKTREGVPVYIPTTHDTASAVVAIPCESDIRTAFISSGTWSIFGAELPSPILSRQAMRLGFSNEPGAAGSTRFLKNIMGLWLVQQSRRSIRESTGIEYSYAELAALAKDAEPGAIIDAVAERFLNPVDMVAEIRSACSETGQSVPSDVGEIMRCCLASLAVAYGNALRELTELVGYPFEALHIIGGGSQNHLLNQWTADACGIPVFAGPSEATALGNVLGQLVASGTIANWQEAREISRRSFQYDTFNPQK